MANDPLQTSRNHNFIITSAGNSLASSNANFYLVTPPVITSQSSPTNIVAIFQTNVTLNFSATAMGITNGFPLGYQWQLNGANIAGADTTNYTFNAGVNSGGNYSVLVTNAAGSTSAVWQVSLTYAGTYIAPGTLSYHLSTNTAAHTNGISDIYGGTMLLSGWNYASYTGTNLAYLTNAVWSTNFWLKGVQGLSATCIGFSNGLGGQGLVTMVSPRHYLFATHMHPEGYLTAFLDTNNVIYWRTTMQRVDIPTNYTVGISNDISVGILNADLPPSVGFLQVLPTDYAKYLPTNNLSVVQGVGMNQNMRVFSQPMTFGDRIIFTDWNSGNAAPFGLTANWNVTIRGGDSSDPEMFLVNNQLVLNSHNFWAQGGPNYGYAIGAINQYMHYLSTNNAAGSDYQLTPFSLTNWPTINQ